MLPYLLVIAGGYLIGQSTSNQLFGKGGKIEPRGEIHLSKNGEALVKLFSPKNDESVGYAIILFYSINDILYSPFKLKLSKSELLKNKEYKSTIAKLKDNYSLKPSDKIHYIEQIEIYPEYRGKGYASYLLKGIISYYKEKGDKYLMLTIGADKSSLNNSELKKFYQRYGFNIIENQGAYKNKMILDLNV